MGRGGVPKKHLNSFNPNATHAQTRLKPPGCSNRASAASRNRLQSHLPWMLEQSERAVSAGDPDAAVAYVERAIRLNPRSADLWLQLARLQLANEDPEAAVQFAQKAISLAGDRVDWIRDAWLLIADARAAQGDVDSAREIRERWRSYRG